ncbi:MAG: aminotransferase class I/II-fold pyridoxal phosphate-dependent enzyme, partial [Candidatus Hodarchaeales archaeon]
MVLSLETLNQNVRDAQYAVRGPIVILAQELEKKGQEIYYFNIGNPQQLGQAPLTYSREILSLLSHPNLLNQPSIKNLFATDSIHRAKKIMNNHPIGLGAYSQSAGMPFIRKAVAEFISDRDNIPTNPDNVFLTDGASKGVDLILNALIANSKDG